MDINYTFIRILSLLTFLYILRLIYGHRLRIGHSWFLFLLGIGLLFLSVWPKAIHTVYVLTGSTSWLSNVLFFSIAFLFIIIIHCTVMISALTTRVKELGQQLAILSSESTEKHACRCLDRQEDRSNERLAHELSSSSPNRIMHL